MSYLRKMFENQPNDDDYVGNIFGWKISIIGAIVIVLVGALVLYGHFTGQIDIETGEMIRKHTVPVDSLQ